MRTQFVVLVFFCLPGSLIAAQQPADLVVRNAKTLTMDVARPSADGFAVTNSRFSFVGPDDELAAYVGPDTRVVDLAGAVVLPGLIDAHLHGVPTYPAGHRLHQVGLSSATTGQMATLVTRLAKQAQARPAGDWILDPEASADRPKIAAFRDWLMQETKIEK